MLRFVLSFCIMYYGTIGFIGLSSEGGYYVSWLDQYFNYVAWMRAALLHSAKEILHWMHFPVELKDAFTIRFAGGAGVHVGYDCIGYGVVYFWIAFIYANQVALSKRLKWLFGGVALIFTVNVIRIALMVISVNYHWKSPGDLDNHTLFNIVAYTVIFSMIYAFDRSEKKIGKQQQVPPSV